MFNEDLNQAIEDSKERIERVRLKNKSKLRDHFAGLAMQGFLAHYGNNGTWDNLSEMSYQIADAMLKARKEVKP